MDLSRFPWMNQNSLNSTPHFIHGSFPCPRDTATVSYSCIKRLFYGIIAVAESLRLGEKQRFSKF